MMDQDHVLGLVAIMGLVMLVLCILIAVCAEAWSRGR